MTRRRAIHSRMNIGPQRGGRSRGLVLEGGIRTILLALVPLGAFVGGQSFWPSGGHEGSLALPSSVGHERDVDDGFTTQPDAAGQRADAAIGRGLVDARALDLATRGARLEARAAMIEALLAENEESRTPSPCRFPSSFRVQRSATPSPSAVPEALAAEPSAGAFLAGLRRNDGSDRPPTDEANRPAPDPDAVAARIDAIEARQVSTVLCLNEAVAAHTTQVRSALLATGLPARRWAADTGIGGPFVPVPSGAIDLDQAAALLRQARGEAGRLDEEAASVPLRKPMEGQVEVTSTFGVRLDPFYGHPALHTGIDLTGAYGAIVEATATGTVTMAGPNGGYGDMVEIDHGHGLTTRYAHLSAVLVVPGQRIAVGTVVGRVGASGRTTGPHLHYETRIDGEPVDPARFLKAGAALFASVERR